MKLKLLSLFTLLSLTSASAISNDTTYNYDVLGRLIFVSNLETGDIDYDYDGAGNREQVSATPPPNSVVINYSWSLVTNPFLGESTQFSWTSNAENCNGSISPGPSGGLGDLLLNGASDTVTFQSDNAQTATLICFDDAGSSKEIYTTFENGCADC